MTVVSPLPTPVCSLGACAEAQSSGITLVGMGRGGDSVGMCFPWLAPGPVLLISAVSGSSAWSAHDTTWLKQVRFR